MTSIEVAANRLTINFECKGQIRKLFNETQFIVEYDTSLQEVPEAVLIIPFLATVAPIAWANQANVFVKNVDATFYQSLELVRKTLERFYPKMEFNGKIYAENVVFLPTTNQTRKMALFSGGLDSLATFVRHQKENPILVSVLDAPLVAKRRLSPNYRHLNVNSENIKRLFNSIKPEIGIIISNWMNIPNLFALRIYEQKLSGEWYMRIMHGLAFIGLCAPLAFVEKVDKLYIASSFTADAQIPWGSHPDIDNKVKWAGTSIEHDGYELSRQEKMFLIADYIQKYEPTLQITACNATPRNSRTIGRNCNVCEKCNRTILGLEIAGINPNEHGYLVSAETFSQMRKKIESGAWLFGDDEIYMWTDLQKYGNTPQNLQNLPHQEAQAFLDWLRKINVESLRSKDNNKMRIDQRFIVLPYPVLKLTEKLYHLSRLWLTRLNIHV